MIDLTPLEVRKKKGDFRKAMRGYEPQAVDDFLDLVADRLEQLVRENASLNERIASAQTQVSDYRERERALTEALVTAQEMREQMRIQMEREVELKIREAEADADAMRVSAAQIREREEENIRRLRARQSQFVQSYRAFLERELAEIGVMSETLDLNRVQQETEAPAVVAPKKRGRKQEPEPAPVATEPAPVMFPDDLAPALSPSPSPSPSLEDHDLIDLTAHLPPEAPVRIEEEIPELELLYEVEAPEENKQKDEDNDDDGWVSSLLEGKGD
jgi:cell division initiation protein